MNLTELLVIITVDVSTRNTSANHSRYDRQQMCCAGVLCGSEVATDCNESNLVIPSQVKFQQRKMYCEW
jgi:hypothetical protein